MDCRCWCRRKRTTQHYGSRRASRTPCPGASYQMVCTGDAPAWNLFHQNGTSGGRYFSLQDVWAFGMFMLEVVCRMEPFQGQGFDEVEALVQAIVTHNLPQLPGS